MQRKLQTASRHIKCLKKLHTLYGKKSDLTIEELQRQFFSFKYDTSKSVIKNCMIIQQYAKDLAAEGEEVKESWIITRMLGMLPPKLHHFRTAWDNVSGADKNISKLFERLRLEEDRLNESEQSNDSTCQNALISKRGKNSGKFHTQGNSFRRMFQVRKKRKKFCKNKPCTKYLAYCKNNYACNTCNQKGHFVKDCPKGNSDESNN